VLRKAIQARQKADGGLLVVNVVAAVYFCRLFDLRWLMIAGL
jgi:hypothetical protein